MASGHLLIIAPDAVLRHSLEFLLEAEGYTITCYASIARTIMPENYDCVVLDHRAARRPTGDVLAFCRAAGPIVLLSGSPQPWLAGRVFRVVQKPLLGEPLSRAIREALASGER